MNEQWKERFAHFEGVPVVDVFGVLEGRGWSGWYNMEGKYPYQPDDLGVAHLTFALWRVADGEPCLTRLRVVAILSYERWNSLAGPHTWSNFSPIVHIKARLAQHPMGFEGALLEEWVGPVSNDAQLNELHRLLSESVLLNLPPLPPLQLTEDGAWVGMVSLPLWERFSLKSGYGSGKVTSEFSFSIDSVEMPSVRLGYKGVPPSPEQVAAYVCLTENEKAVQDAVLQAILANYPRWQKSYGIGPEYMPDVSQPEEFQSLLLLWDLSISLEAKNGFAYVLLSLIPEWDIEHGLGAIVHNERVVAVGDHDSIGEAIEQDMEAGESGE